MEAGGPSAALRLRLGPWLLASDPWPLAYTLKHLAPNFQPSLNLRPQPYASRGVSSSSRQLK